MTEPITQKPLVPFKFKGGLSEEAFVAGIAQGVASERARWEKLEHWLEVERTKRPIYGSEVAEKMSELSQEGSQK